MVVDRGDPRVSDPRHLVAALAAVPSEAPAERRRLLVPVPGRRGQDVLSARAVVDAVVADLSDQPGVRKAGARLSHQDPLVVDAWVDYDSASYVPAFRQSVQEQIVPRLEKCLEIEDAVVNLELRLVSGTTGRVE